MQQNKVFNSGDIFDDQFLDAIEPAEYVNVGAFFHIFDAETQRDVCRRLTRLCKRAIIGWKSGALIPTELPKPLSFKGTMMWYSLESFTRMWDEVTGGKWHVEINARDNLAPDGQLFVEMCEKDKEFCSSVTTRTTDRNFNCLDLWVEDFVHEHRQWQLGGFVDNGRNINCPFNRSLLHELREKYGIQLKKTDNSSKNAIHSSVH
ncbi:unnamed protein product [Rotaria sp. Silwood2]|nr:unnamed protein product [Rotaria sp. Silwood2]